MSNEVNGYTSFKGFLLRQYCFWTGISKCHADDVCLVLLAIMVNDEAIHCKVVDGNSGKTIQGCPVVGHPIKHRQRKRSWLHARRCL